MQESKQEVKQEGQYGPANLRTRQVWPFSSEKSSSNNIFKMTAVVAILDFSNFSYF